MSLEVSFVSKIDIYNTCVEPPYTILQQSLSVGRDVLGRFFLQKNAFSTNDSRTILCLNLQEPECMCETLLPGPATNSTFSDLCSRELLSSKYHFVLLNVRKALRCS
jgi:hypothetical protein